MAVVLTTRQIADLFGVSTAQVKRWAVFYPQQLGAYKRTPRGVWLFPEDKAHAAFERGLVDESVAV